jgi:hypothetical protein
MDIRAIPTMSEGDCYIFETVEFPQANDLDKVYRVTECVAVEGVTPDEVAEFLGIVPREGQYYGSAACALRLTRRRESVEGVFYELTEFGSDWAAAEPEERRRLMLERTLDAPHVKFVAHALGEDLPLTRPLPVSMLDPERIESVLGSLPDLGPVTRHRRASTIASWMRTVERL